MKIAIASGKGGTGKTTVAVSLALSAEGPVTFIDCDVEEPNAHIFLNPSIQDTREVEFIVPKIDEGKCNFCGRCRDICQFHAITVFGKTIMAFPEMCHSCRGCFLVCDQGAILEGKRTIGTVEHGRCQDIDFFQGRARVGEAMSSPLIKEVKRDAYKVKSNITILDAPPGTSCPVIKTVRDTDYVILVTEPTPFGLHDLKLAAGTIKRLGLPAGVIINKAGLGDDGVINWCKANGLEILMEIPFSKTLAQAYSQGIPLVEKEPGFKKDFMGLLERLNK